MRRSPTLMAAVLVATLGFAAPAAAQESANTNAELARLEKAVAQDSTRFEDLYRLGVLYMDRERHPEAQRVLTKASLLRPNDVKVLVNLGAAYDAANRSADAQAYYRRALEVAPGDSVASCRLASSLYAQGRSQEAVDLLRGVVKSQPRSHCAYFTLGVAFADAGLYRDAIRMWQKTVEYGPDTAEGLSAKESIDVLTRYLQGGAR
jgi:tetratricopeptide (TPR) repeat protein